MSYCPSNPFNKHVINIFPSFMKQSWLKKYSFKNQMCFKNTYLYFNLLKYFIKVKWSL